MKLGDILEKSRAKDSSYIIRYIKWEDIDDLLQFANKLSREDTYVMLSGEEITRKQQVEYVANSISMMEKGEKIHLVVSSKGRIVGNAEVRPEERRRKHVGSVTIAFDKVHRGRGLGVKLWGKIIKEARKLGYRLLMISVFEINKAGIKAYENAGFVKYGLLPGALYYRGEYVNEVYYYCRLYESIGHVSNKEESPKKPKR